MSKLQFLTPEECETLVQFTEWYISCRELAPIHENNLRRQARRLQEFADMTTLPELFRESVVNAYLASLKFAPSTIRNQRVDILTLWNSAADEDLVPYPRRRRIRRNKVPAEIIDCYTVDEVRSLVYATQRMRRGCYPNGVSRRAYWQAIVRTAFETGLRRSDLWLLRQSSINDNGLWRVVQHKTGRVASGVMRQETLALVRGLSLDQPFAWPWDAARFCRQFVDLKKRAGVCRGTFKWLRRASGSYVESIMPGMGWKHLGHTSPATFLKHYDAKLAPTQVIQPPPLDLEK